MNEKKKSLIVLGVLLVLFTVIIVAVIMSLMQSAKKLEEIEKVMNSKTPQIVYLSKPTCYYCNLIEPITTFLEEEYELEYHHIDTGNLSNAELTKVLDIMNINVETFGTPYIAIVQNGEIIGEQVGYTDEDVLFNLFKTHNLIEGDTSLNMNYVENLDNIWNDDKASLVLVGTSGDTATIDARLSLLELAKNHSLEINYFDTAMLETNDAYNELLNKLDGNDLPVLVIIKDGKVISKTTKTALQEYESFLDQNGYIK